MKEQSSILCDKASVYLELGREKSAVYIEQFLDWSAVYRKQAAVYASQAFETGKTYSSKALGVAGVYFNAAAKYARDVMNDDRVQVALKFTQVRIRLNYLLIHVLM